MGPVYREIAKHPFNVELSEGTLSQERFEFYIRQDIAYLEVVSHIFALISRKASSPHVIQGFHRYSVDSQLQICDLRERFLSSNETGMPAVKSPACRDYSNFLLSLATTASLEESITAFLPCFWIYRELSREMARLAKKSNPYWHWIFLNSSQENSEMTDEMISFIEELAQNSSKSVQSLMERVCETASHFELRFWNDAYNMQVIDQPV